jgi:hypothetical protein
MENSSVKKPLKRAQEIILRDYNVNHTEKKEQVNLMEQLRKLRLELHGTTWIEDLNEFKDIMETEKVAEKPKGEYEKSLPVIKRNDHRIKILSQRINKEREDEVRQASQGSPVKKQEMNEERRINRSPRQVQENKFKWEASDHKKEPEVIRRQKGSAKKRKDVVIRKLKEKLKNEEISSTSSDEYENLDSDEQEAEEIDRDYNLDEKSDACLRHEIIEWAQEMESYRFKSILRIMPKHHKKIMEWLKLVINRITRNFKKINPLGISGITETQKKYIHASYKLMTFLLRQLISEKIGKKISYKKITRENVKARATLKESYDGEKKWKKTLGKIWLNLSLKKLP